MKLVDSAKLALLAAVAGGRVFVDACKDVLGISMPYAVDRVSTPALLSQWINRYQVEPLEGPASIASAASSFSVDENAPGFPDAKRNGA